MANHHGQGGIGAAELAEKVVEVCEKNRAEGSAFKFLYPLESTSIKQKIGATALHTLHSNHHS